MQIIFIKEKQPLIIGDQTMHYRIFRKALHKAKQGICTQNMLVSFYNKGYYTGLVQARTGEKGLIRPSILEPLPDALPVQYRNEYEKGRRDAIDLTVSTDAKAIKENKSTAGKTMCLCLSPEAKKCLMEKNPRNKTAYINECIIKDSLL